MAVKPIEVVVEPDSSTRIWTPLTQRNFLLLWVGQSVSLLGDQFYFIALAWLTLQLTGSPLALGTVLMVAAIPRATLMLVGGAVTDRFSPRTLMLSSDIARAVLIAALAIAVLSGNVQLWELYLIALIFGALDAAFYPASSSITPSVVETGLLPAANALMQSALQGSNLLGPVLAGLLVAGAGRSVGIGGAFAFDAATFVVSVLTLTFMRTRSPANPSEHGRDSILAAIVEGLRYAWNDRALRALLIAIAGIDATVNGVFGVGMPLLARLHFGGATAFGIMSSGFGAGALLGIVGAGSFGTLRHRGRWAIAVIVVFAAGTVLLPFAGSIGIAVILIAAMGAGSGFINVLLIPWIQTRPDPAMLGRIMSLVMFASVGLTPVAYAVSGWVASLGLTWLFLGGGVLLFATALYTALSPARAID
jgi:MFS family permease